MDKHDDDDNQAGDNECNVPSVLTIAGSDSGGGAGIQADLKTFTALRVYGASVLTALTAQNTQGVQDVHIIPPVFIAQQMDSIFSDMNDLSVVKTGMLPNIEVIRTVAKHLKSKIGNNTLKHIVVDPVLVATSGDDLVVTADGMKKESIIDVMKNELFPVATLVTPNLPEARAICGFEEIEGEKEEEGEEEIRKLAKIMVDDFGCSAVLVKGGHMKQTFLSKNDSKMNMACDILYDGEQFEAFVAPWVDTKNTHGTGCTLASAIAACLAKGMSLRDAVRTGKQFVWNGLQEGRSLHVGNGNGPLFHMHTVHEFSMGTS